jgi:glyoxylase-like metal-dependent hydrolase (beta-lactamase superfamily II)
MRGRMVNIPAESDIVNQAAPLAVALPSLRYPLGSRPATGTTLEVASGVHWLRMPLPFALDHINLWLLEDEDQLSAIDTGINDEPTKSAWQAVLAKMGRGQDISRVIVTHLHPDHIGLAHWLSVQHDAPVWMTQGEFVFANALFHGLPGFRYADLVELFVRHGLDAERAAQQRGRGNPYRSVTPELPLRFNRLLDGDTLHIGEHNWQVIAGCGHSPEHISLYSASAGVLISGDMLLPRISTNVAVIAAEPEGDPLCRFLDSIVRFTSLPEETLVLPSHGEPFRGLHARVAQLQAHHAERCELLLDALSQPRHAAELLPLLFPRTLDAHQLMFAMGEAIAHLNYLAHQGEIKRIEGKSATVQFVRC